MDGRYLPACNSFEEIELLADEDAIVIVVKQGRNHTPKRQLMTMKDTWLSLHRKLAWFFWVISVWGWRVVLVDRLWKRIILSSSCLKHRLTKRISHLL